MTKVKEYKIFPKPIHNIVNGIDTKMNILPLNIVIYEQSGQYYMCVNNQDKLTPIKKLPAA